MPNRGCLLEETPYLVKAVSTKTKCTTFHEPRFENDTRKRASRTNLSLAFNSIKGHLYHCSFNIQEQNSIFKKPGSHANPFKFCWGFDGDEMTKQDAAINAKTYLEM